MRVFLSPELIKSIIKKDFLDDMSKIDIYSIGSVLFKMITGKSLFQVESLVSLYDITENEINFNKNIDNRLIEEFGNKNDELKSILKCMLSYKIDDRLSFGKIAGQITTYIEKYCTSEILV